MRNIVHATSSASKNPENFWRAAMFGTVIFFVLTGVTINYRLSTMGEESRSVAHAEAALSELAQLLGELRDVEVGQRGYLLTQNLKFLKPKLIAEASIPRTLNALEISVSSQPAMLRALQTVRKLVQEKLHEVNRVLRVARLGGAEAAAKLIRRGRGNDQMDQLRALIRLMERVQEEVLKKRLVRFEATRTGSKVITTATVLFTIAFTLLTLYLNAAFKRSSNAARREVAKRMLVEDALRTSEERLNVALSLLPLRLYSTDLERRYTWMHDSQQSGEVSEVIGKRDEELFGLDAVSTLVELEETALKSGERVRSVLTLPFTGESVSYEVIVVPVKDVSGKIEGLLISAFDIQSQIDSQQEINAREKELFEEREQFLLSERSARETAERAIRANEEYVATLSHELRGPLNAILGWTQILRTNMSDPALLTRGVNVIEQNARVQSQLVSDLFDMHRIHSGKFSLSLKEVNLSKLVLAAIDAALPACQAKNIKLIRKLDAENIKVMADVSRITQVLMNLLNNSIKFTPEGGEIVVSLGTKNNQAVVQVSDTGIGIDAEQLSTVFARYNQGGHRDGGQFGGLGLGLSIARNLIRLHNGSIEARSDGLGRGSTFEFWLPLIENTNSLSIQTEHRLVDTTIKEKPTLLLHDITILVVEDQDDARNATVRLLSDNGATVSGVNTGMEALCELKRKRPAVIISDISMPGMDGYTLMREVRAAYGDIPAIALTAFVRPEDQERAIAAGFTRHISKPLQISDLISTIREVVSFNAQSKQATSIN